MNVEDMSCLARAKWALALLVILLPPLSSLTIANAQAAVDQSSADPSFIVWLDASARNRAEFEAFQQFLRRRQVADIVPVRQLLRADVDNASRCHGAMFVIPPRNLWSNIVAPLKIVRDLVVPHVGRVEVRSVFREHAINVCASGAPHSRHLSFSAIDVVAVNQRTSRDTFASLCAIWRKRGRHANWGLGAYFDPSQPLKNADGRFHIDATGWRSWGFDKHGASSGCTLMTAPKSV